MYGTLTTLDSLAATQATIAQIGEDNAFQAIDAAFQAHNRITREMMSSFIQTTTDRQRRYGGSDTVVMQELDQFGMPDAQKVSAGVTIGIPLRKFGDTLQWTRTAFQVLTGTQMASQVRAILTADLVLRQREIKRALFYPTNVTFLDRFVDNVTLNVKRLVNADSAAMPLGPNGETFNSATHTHYLGTASFVAADLTSAIETVLEHYGSGQAMVYINRAQETAIRAFTGFTAYLDARIVGANNVNQTRGALDPTNLYDRAIGLYNGAEVVVKPWIPANYVVVWLSGQPVPLLLRERSPGSGDLQLEFEDENHPLRARSYFSEFGIGVWTRTNGAVLLTNNATYSAPTLN